MNLAATAPTWLLLILAAALGAAAIEDAVRLRISNITCLAVLIAALIAMGMQGFPMALWQNAVVFLVLLALGTPLFASGKVGGGDIKLLACIGLWMDFRSAIWLLATVFIAGGVLALLYLGPRLVFPAPRGEDGKPVRRQIPYGLAIVAGACLVFAGQLGWMKPEPAKPNPFSVRV